MLRIQDCPSHVVFDLERARIVCTVGASVCMQLCALPGREGHATMGDTAAVRVPPGAPARLPGDPWPNIFITVRLSRSQRKTWKKPCVLSA